MRKHLLGRRTSAAAFSILAVLSVGLVTTAVAAPAVVFDVNNAGVFELDGNVCHDSATVAPIDFANAACSGSTVGTVGLFNSDYTQAIMPGSTIPVGGKSAMLVASTMCDDATTTTTCDATGDLAFTQGSKDIASPSGWTCTSKPVTPKDEIDNSAAALLLEPNSDGSNHLVLYQNIERGVINGTSNAGFWLFQQPVGCSIPSGKSSATFSGSHTDGDVLLFATFNSGTATIEAYAWKGGLNTANPISSGQACSQSTTDLCGMVNIGSITTPWAPHNTTAILPNGYFEVGFDLTDFYKKLGTPVPCFSTFMADTRASGSQGNAVDSDLHDFMLGNLDSCKATITTQPDNSASPTSLPVWDGTAFASAFDQATVSGVAGFPTPTGNVSFAVCGPVTTVKAAGPNCDSSGPNYTSLGTVPLTAGSAKSPPATFSKVGTYCFTSTYLPTAGSGYKSVTESAGAECISVTPLTPTIVTTGSVTTGGTTTSSTATVSASGPLGSTTVADSAVLSGTAPEPGTPVINPTSTVTNAMGSITFTLYGPGDCSTAAASPGGVTVNGDGTYSTPAQTIMKAGTYNWAASYSGDNPNTASITESCSLTKTQESVTLSTVPSSLHTDQSWVPNDTVTVEKPPAGTGDLAGTVTITGYSDGTCGKNSGTAFYGPVKLSVAGSGGNSVDVSTSNTTPFTIGTSVSWLVSYKSTNLAQRDISATCLESSTLTISNGGSVSSLD